MIRTGTPDLRFQQTTIVQNVLLERSAFGTECPAIDRMIWITFHVHDLWNGILGFVAKCINDYTAAHRAVWTSAACFCRARYLQSLSLRIDRSKAEAEG